MSLKTSEIFFNTAALFPSWLAFELVSMVSRYSLWEAKNSSSHICINAADTVAQHKAELPGYQLLTRKEDKMKAQKRFKARFRLMLFASHFHAKCRKSMISLY